MIYATNPRAYFDYQILETLEAGLVLKGHEVKAVKSGKLSIKGAYVKIIGGEAWLIGATVSPYQPANTSADYDPQHSRKLLLSKKEIYNLSKKLEAGLTAVPVKVYGKKNLVKLEIGIARGKKKYDKREALKKREFERKEKSLTK